MERVDVERVAAAGSRTDRTRAPALPSPPPIADVLALQRTAGNQRVSQLLSQAPGRAVQRQLDDDFEHGGVPTEEEKRTCDAFAKIVSAIVDRAHVELLAGKVSDWTGAKITTFLGLLTQGHPAALVHAGNAIEERVYALMNQAALPAEWRPQFAEAMGGASKPDIVVLLGEDREALIDVTSSRGHILGKAGAWTTSGRYVYVAEAWYPSVLAAHLPYIREAVKSGGLDDTQLESMRAAVDEQRRQRAEMRQQQVDEARELFWSYGNFTRFAEEAFGGDRTGAAAWMRENGLGTIKGVPKRKGPRRQSAETRQKARQKAAKRNYALNKDARKRAAEQLRHSARAEKFEANRGLAVAEGGEAETEASGEMDESGGFDDEQIDDLDEGGFADDEFDESDDMVEGGFTGSTTS